MLNFRNWTVDPRILMMTAICLLGLISIRLGGLERRIRAFSLPLPEASSAPASETKVSSPKSPSSVKPIKANSLYRKHCQKCHSLDGTGTDGRNLFSEIPDFTSAKWHKGRGNARLVSSILDGKGTSMPAFGGKLSNDEVKALAAFVRSFDLPEIKPREATESDFDKQVQELFEQMKELRKQFRELSRTSGGP